MTGIKRTDLLEELARDGAWTLPQLRARQAAWGLPDPDGLVQRVRVRVRPTAFSHRRIETTLVRPSAEGIAALRRAKVRPQEIRPQELEHALGLAELRFRCGAREDAYVAQDAIGREHRHLRALGGKGFGGNLADGVMRTDRGVVLLEYDHGRYTARQVREKLRVQQTLGQWNGERVIGAVWGAPTARRAAWLSDRGVTQVVVLQPETWMTTG